MRIRISHETLDVTNHLVELEVDGRIILKLILNDYQREGVDCIYVAQETNM